jgi:hypothetical protein
VPNWPLPPTASIALFTVPLPSRPLTTTTSPVVSCVLGRSVRLRVTATLGSVDVVAMLAVVNDATAVETRASRNDKSRSERATLNGRRKTSSLAHTPD